MHEHNPNFSQLLPFYRKEMDYLLTVGQEFAKAYPGVAQELELSAKGSSDPHVERLLESFAFLTARLQMEIEDHHALISQNLLSVLYPQMTEPFPSCVMMKLTPPKDSIDLFKGRVLPARTPLSTTSKEGITCKFQTTMDTTIWPLEVEDATYVRTNTVTLPKVELKSPWLLKISLKSLAGMLSDMCVDELSFHLSSDMLTAFTLLRWLNTYDTHQSIPILWSTPNTSALKCLPPDSLGSVGFEANQDILPRTPYVSSAQRWLWDFFHFPQKFLFFSVKNLATAFKQSNTESIDLFFPLGAATTPEKWPLNKNNVMLGCVPAVNLFSKTSEPIRLDYKKTLYPLVPDYLLERSTEVHSIQKISSATNIDEPSEELAPFFSYTHDMEKREQQSFWIAHRTQSKSKEVVGTEMMLSFVDYRVKTKASEEKTIYAHTLCTNRRYAEKIPVQTRFDVLGDFSGLHAHSLSQPTRQTKIEPNSKKQWQFINHLAMDHLGLCAHTQSINPLKELLYFYNRGHTSLGFAIDALLDIRFEKKMGILSKKAWKSFVPLLSVTVKVDDQKANTQGFFLLCSLLHNFFRMTADFNTLVETKIEGLSHNMIKEWPAEPCVAHTL